MDDEKIVKTIRKLLIIYRSQLRKKAQIKFLKWRLITHKLKIIQTSLSGVYKKKKVQDMPLLVPEERSYVDKQTPHSQNKQTINKSEEENLRIFQSTNNESIRRSRDFSSELKEEPQPQTMTNSRNMLSHSPMVVNKVENFTIDKKPLEIHERLYNDRIRRDVVQNEMAKHFRYQEVKDCTFTPKINSQLKKQNKIPNDQPSYIKLYDNRKEKEDHMRFLSLEREKRMNEVYTFQPNVNSKYKMKRQSSDFYERQKMYSSSKTRRLRQIQEDVEKSIPSPSKRPRPSSAVRSRDTSLINLSTDRIDKITEYKRKRTENLKKIEESMLMDQGVTFKPKLNESINANINSSLIERNEEFMRNKSQKLRTIANKEENECTFSPKINEKQRGQIYIDNSETLPVGDRLFRYQHKYQQNAHQKKEMYKENYSFKPDINSNTYEILKQRELIMEEIRNKYNNENSINQATGTNNGENIRKSEINEIEENPNENDSNIMAEEECLSISREQLKQNKQSDIKSYRE